MSVKKIIAEIEHEPFVLPAGTEMTPKLLREFIDEHKKRCKRFEELHKMYVGHHEILKKAKKAEFKPDNRLVANFAKYIVDTFNGFFIGIPIKQTHDIQDVAEYLEYFSQFNGLDDETAELSKLCSIYGNAYEILYTDENANPCVSQVDPREAFVIYDNSIIKRPMFGVRYYQNCDDVLEGSFSTATFIQYFHDDGGIRYDDVVQHYFGDVPMIEYVENEERIGTFESVETLINAYNKSISEKANDVDYYADAYMKILGAPLEKETLDTLRDNRIINLPALDGKDVDVDFLQKPDADGTQEHLIDRLERLIFHLSMVANINDENFGTSSGIALKYKLQSMSNLAMTKERKFVSGFNKRYKMLANLPTSRMGADDWTGIKYKFTRNIPSNELEEAQIASQLAGITSEETQLSVLSIVDDVKAEIEKKEVESASGMDSFSRLGTQDSTPKANTTGSRQMYAITSILDKFSRGKLTRQNAKKMLMLLDLTEDEADEYLDSKDEIIEEQVL